MRFTKMHGLGNDYVVVNGFQEVVDDPSSLACAMSDRHRGVGSDGLLVIHPAADADLRMEIYNADGSRGLMCGNGLRCVAKYAYERGLCRKALIRVATACGIRLAECFPVGDKVVRVRVAMGAAEYLPRGLAGFSGRQVVTDEPFLVNGRTLPGTFVSMGNPHLVVFVQDLDEIDLAADGPVLEKHECFPDRINVHFARIHSRHEISMVSWERGSGAVQACGSGACAVADAAFTHRQTAFPTTVRLPGGELLIERGDAGLLMTGPAEEVFSGDWCL
ncbi:MAG: diaminopimelate epimerase [Phycisphaerae bacterium]|nr:diaminopimelate epimerase [Phycisphaerae bacterium]